MCTMANEIPQLFDWDAVRNQPGDRWSRPELNHAVVEFVAPTEYMVRAPPPYTIVFLIDVSHNAIQSGEPMLHSSILEGRTDALVMSGMVATATRTILENLDRIPNGDQRTKIGIIAFDVALHFFSIPVRAAHALLGATSHTVGT
jgi:protein transport protein SEC24